MRLHQDGYGRLAVGFRHKGETKVTQNTLSISSGRRKNWGNSSGDVGVVALSRYDNQEITLRFLAQGRAWGEPAREVRLDLDLAEQLRWLLTNELEDAADMV